MRCAVILGYQGFGNVGDEAILTGIEHLLQSLPFEVQAVLGGPEPIKAFPRARRIITRRLRPNIAAIRALMRADVLLFSGGGLIHDHWPTVLPVYLTWSAIARLAGARVAWIGVGIGPLRSTRSRFLAGRMLRLASLVTVRDTSSARLAHQVARDLPVTIVPDPAFLNRAPGARARHGVGVIVRAPAPADAAHADALAAALGSEIGTLMSQGREAFIITLGGRPDRPFANAVRDAALAAGADPAVEELEPDPSLVLERLASLEAIITVRLHGLILGVIAGTPAVAVAYDDKVSQVAEQLGLSDLCIAIPDALSAPSGTITGLLSSAETTTRRVVVAGRLRGLRSSVETLRNALVTLAGGDA